MCGIAGVMTKDGTAPDPAVLDRLADALAHRGPDGRGRHVARNIGMIHNRLAIIDLETGAQPLYEPGGAALVANAEIYNYVELRAALPQIAFATASDCEPALHLYRRDGRRFVEQLRGMYALALHDPAEDLLLLARDPFGIKPLYYVETDTAFAFASEPQALVAAGLAGTDLNRQVLMRLLQLQFTTGSGTIFDGVSRLLPGETLVVRDGRIVERQRIQALPAGAPTACSAREAMTALDTVLIDSVDVHQRSDVPYGMFLSGGIDSSALLVLMAELNERPVHTLTVGFGGTAVPDERVHARAVAAALRAEPEEMEFGEDDFWQLLPEIAAALDDPAADYAVLPTYKLAARAKAAGLKVILCGEGGDEIFGGYGRYRAAMRPWWRGGRSMRSRGIFDGLGVLRGEMTGWRDGLVAAEATVSAGGRTRLQVAQAMDCADWLPNDLLTKLDRCLMAHSVEGRTPFLDPRVAEVAFRLPDQLKVRGGVGKWLLRTWLDSRLPRAKAFSKKKGFTVPVAEWIARRGRDVGALVAAHPAVEALCDPAAVQALYARRDKRAGHAAWTLLFYALWHNRHVLGQVPHGDVFATLGRA